MNILEGAEITDFEIDNPLISEFSVDVQDTIDKASLLEICDYIGINDNNFTDNDSINKISKIIGIIGKENALEKIQNLVSEVGFKQGMLDDIYAKVRLDSEIKRTSKNLKGLLKQKYGDSNQI